MAVSLNSLGTPDHAGSAVTTHDAVITVNAGSNIALLLQIAFDLSTPTGVGAVWDPLGANQAMSLITSAAFDGSNGLLQIWGLVNPTPAASHVTISWTNATDLAAVAVALNGVNQTGGASSFTEQAATNGNSTTPSITVTASSGDETMATTYNLTSAISGDTQTTTINDASMANGAMAGSRADATGNMTHSWTQSTGLWKCVGARIIAAGGGGAAGFMWI